MRKARIPRDSSCRGSASARSQLPWHRVCRGDSIYQVHQGNWRMMGSADITSSCVVAQACARRRVTHNIPRGSAAKQRSGKEKKASGCSFFLQTMPNALVLVFTSLRQVCQELSTSLLTTKPFGGWNLRLPVGMNRCLDRNRRGRGLPLPFGSFLHGLQKELMIVVREKILVMTTAPRIPED